MYSEYVRMLFTNYLSYIPRIVSIPGDTMSRFYLKGKLNDIDRINNNIKSKSDKLKLIEDRKKELEKLLKEYDDVSELVEKDKSEKDSILRNKEMIKYGTNAAVLGALGYGGYKLYKKFKNRPSKKENELDEDLE